MSKILGLPPKKKRLQYDRSNLSRAYQATQSGMSVYRAARLYKIPESTLRDRTLGNVTVDAKNGTGTLLSIEEERKLVQHISYMAEIGYGYNKSNIQYMARDYAVSVGKDVQASDSLSNCWFYGFMQRWPELKIAKPQKLALLRAKATSREVLDQYYNELGTILTSNNLLNKPERIYNIDETGISTEHSPPKIVCGKDTNPQSVTSPRGSTITVIASGNALGNSIPPYYVFQGVRWNDDFLKGSCPGADGEMSKNGWSTGEVFRNYITKHFTKYSNVSSGSAAEPILVLYDGHRSHISLTLTEWARTNHVILFVLPPHTSHLTQPLDVGVFGPFKSMYSRECQVYLKNHPGIAITKYEVAELTSRPYVKALAAENLISAFRKTGIYPFNSSTITDPQVAPSTIYTNQKEGDAEDTTSHPDPEPTPTTTTKPTTEQEASETPESSTSITTEPPVIVTSESLSSAFFKERTITTAVVNKPKRKFVPPFITGNLLKKSVTDILSEQSSTKKAKQTIPHTKTKTSTCETRKPSGKAKGQNTLKQKKQQKKEKDLTVRREPAPSTSGLNIGGAPLNLDSPQETSDSASESEDEKCCVCGDWQPEEIRGCHSIVFVKWAKCDYCPHWTHLQFCTKSKWLRLRSSSHEHIVEIVACPVSCIFLGDTGIGVQSWIETVLGKEMTFPHLRILYPTAPPRPYTPMMGHLSTVWYDRKQILPSSPDDDSIDQTAAQLVELIQSEVDNGIPRNRIILGGYSMGGGMSLHLGYRFVRDVAGVFALSSFLADESKVFKDLRRESSPTPPLFQSHGEQDELVLYQWGKDTYNKLTTLGVPGVFLSVPGLAHELDRSTVLKLQDWINEILPPDT